MAQLDISHKSGCGSSLSSSEPESTPQSPALPNETGSSGSDCPLINMIGNMGASTESEDQSEELSEDASEEEEDDDLQPAPGSENNSVQKLYPKQPPDLGRFNSMVVEDLEIIDTIGKSKGYLASLGYRYGPTWE